MSDALAITLRRRREFVGYSVVGLSLASGVPVGTIAGIECGRITEPDGIVVARLAQALNTDTQDLVVSGEPARTRFRVIQGGRRAAAQHGPEVA